MTTKRYSRARYFTGLVALLCVCATAYAAKNNSKLPPRQKQTKEDALGDSEAMKEVNRLTQDEPENTEMSGALAPVTISTTVIKDLRKSEEEAKKNKESKTEVTVQKLDEIPKESEGEPPVPTADAPEVKYWRFFKKKPELGFMTGWAFTHKDLATLAGSGFAFGLMGTQEIDEKLQVQVRLNASHHTKDETSRRNRLWIVPTEILMLFTKQVGEIIFYVQPGLGAAYWNSSSARTVDGYTETAHGFDFMASGGVGLKYRIPNQDWKVGADYSFAYVSGYFDNYFSRIMVYSSYQF